jgi:hypothetical protein
MNAGMIVLLVQTGAVWFMVGFIWVMQVLHYPLFDRVGRDAFPRYETDHNRLFGLLVGPGVAIAVVTTLVLLILQLAQIPVAAIGLEVVLLAVIIFSTARWQAPQHGRLAKGFDQRAYDVLVQSNWIRTVAWSVFGLLDLWLIGQVVGRLSL